MSELRASALGLVYLVGIAAFPIAGLWATGWACWSLGWPPDQSPFTMLCGTLASLALSFVWGHHGLRLIMRSTTR